MILKVFCVYDSKVEAYMSPFFLHTKGAAIRAFSDMAKDGQSQFSKHPGDFTLFEIGEYDDARASFTNLTAPLSLGTALELSSVV